MNDKKGKRNPNHRHGDRGTRFYNIWGLIKQRTLNPKNPFADQYLNKGIRICDRWKIYLSFKEDMYEGYKRHVKKYGEKNTQIDRIDGNGNYEPSNCRWVTIKEQNLNRKNIRLYEYRGVMLCLKDWSRVFNINPTTIYYRLKRGIPLKNILDKRLMPYKKGDVIWNKNYKLNEGKE